MVKKARSISLFEAYIQSPETREKYLFLLTKFTEHFKLKSIDSILSLETQDLKEKIEDYVILFKDNGKSVAYIRLILFSLQSFCEANDIEGINFKKIRKLLGKKQKPKKTRPFTTDEIKLMLGVTKELRSKAIILFFSASGIRRGALLELKIRDLKEMPNDCLAVTVYADSDDEYITFINKESKEALTRYFEKRKKDGERLDDEHPVFRSGYSFGIAKTKRISKESVSDIIKRAKNNSGIKLDGKPNMLCHAFRRRFNTILKLQQNANISSIERLMGHSVIVPLDNSYFQPEADVLFAEYQKGIADLTIDDKTRVLEELRESEKEKSELEQAKQDKDKLALSVKSLQKSQEEMKNRLDKIDMEEEALHKLVISEEKLSKAIREKVHGDEFDELMVQTVKLREEYSKIAYGID